MAQREYKTKTAVKHKEEVTETSQPTIEKKSGQELKDEMDELLDEIDEVLEENAQDFVASYVQKGGQ